MKYMLSKPDGFLSKPEATSLMKALANSEGCHLYVYDEQDQLILVHDLTDNLKFYIEVGITAASEHKKQKNWKNLRGEELLNFAYNLDNTGKNYRFKNWIIMMAENLIRESKGVPLMTERVPYAD